MPTRDEPLGELERRIVQLREYVGGHEARLAELQGACDLLDAKQAVAQASRDKAEKVARSAIVCVETSIETYEAKIVELRKAIRQSREEHAQLTRDEAELIKTNRAAINQDAHDRGEAQRKLKESGWGEYRRKQAHLVKLEGRFEARQEVVASRKAQREGERAAAIQAAAEAAQKASQEHREKVVAEAKRVLANLEPEALAQA